MDIQSFILGMCAVLLIALVIGSVVALVKVLRLEKNSNNINIGFQQQIDLLKRDCESNDEVLATQLGQQINQVYQDIDSRMDKLYNKILKESNPKERILQMIKGEKTTNSSEE